MWGRELPNEDHFSFDVDQAPRRQSVDAQAVSNKDDETEQPADDDDDDAPAAKLDGAPPLAGRRACDDDSTGSWLSAAFASLVGFPVMFAEGSTEAARQGSPSAGKAAGGTNKQHHLVRPAPEDQDASDGPDASRCPSASSRSSAFEPSPPHHHAPSIPTAELGAQNMDPFSTPDSHSSSTPRTPRDLQLVEPLTITLIRHGQGYHNVNTNSLVTAGRSLVSDLMAVRVMRVMTHGKRLLRGTLKACNIYDPSLTSLGIKQAQCAAEALADVDFDVVYVSPMMRTVETALQIFGRRKGLQLILHPDCCETRIMFEGSNAGRPKSELIVAVNQEMEREKWDVGINYDYIRDGERWWVGFSETQACLESRADKFRRFLLAREAGKRVAVVSHATFLRALTSDSLLSTCEWRSYICSSTGFLPALSGHCGKPELPDADSANSSDSEQQSVPYDHHTRPLPLDADDASPAADDASPAADDESPPAADDVPPTPLDTS
ncbi:hypothetical protein DIPPA_06308 [Diplonema papillatum]|nr:hypothetical protein DIPPA_06308 [Diplonema papillatum]